MLQSKSVLARLLANENISVEQGNYPTAFFDVENRTLGLPLWKEMSADETDLLIGHEIGHALFTPQTKEEITVPGVPHSYMNVVEDIRIERKVLDKYPGLVSNFKRGYLGLMNRDIFGTKDNDINEMGFMDRLNLKAKGRDLVEVEFSEEEMPYFKKAMAVETFEDVANVCKELVAWLGDGKKEQEDGDETTNGQSQPEESEESEMTAQDIADLFGESSEEQSEEGEPSDSDSDSDEDGDEGEESGAGEASGESEESDQEGEKSSNGEESEEKSEENSESSVSSGAGNSPDDVPENLPEIKTEKAQRENMSDLVEETDKMFLQGMNRAVYDIVKVGYKEVLETRKEFRKKLVEHDYQTEMDDSSRDYDAFMSENKGVVNLMAKEFEMRKAAYRSARARTSTKGSIDVNKLHAYKYDDNLFKQVTTLADGKNHGMMMLVDYSGSMYQQLDSVIRQTISLVQFCKRVNIPFEVFAFTTDNNGRNRLANIRQAGGVNTKFDYEDLVFIELFSNKMSKSELEYAMRTSFFHGQHPRCMGSLERLGSTPLNAAVLASQFAIQDFLRTNPVHKMNLITLTDGASDPARHISGKDVENQDRGWAKRYVMNVKGKQVELASRYGYDSSNTSALLNAVAGKNVQTANFFICTRRDFKYEQHRLLPWDTTAQRKAQKEMRDNGVWIMDNADGYDRRFIMVDKSASMSGENDEFQVDAEATPAQIARAFKKFSGSKKGNRVITTKFAELVA